MRIEPRTAWGARAPKSVDRIGKTPRLWLHHSVTGTGPLPGVIKSIQAFHMDQRGWFDIGYSFLVSVDGRIWMGRGPFVAGGHSATDLRPLENFESHAVCAIGNFDVQRPPVALLDGLARIAAYGYDQGWWATRGYTGGHRDVPGASTACPGKYLYAQLPEISRRSNIIVNTPGSGGLTVSEAQKIRKEMKAADDGQNRLIAELGKMIRDLRKEGEARAAESRFYAKAIRDLADRVEALEK